MKKIIHRIFFNFDNKPDPFLPYLETWKKELPDFEVMHWNEKNLPLDLNEYTAYMAKTKNYAFLSDYFRCFILRHYGGLYFDTDIEVLNGGVLRQIYTELQESDNYTLCIGIENESDGGLTTCVMGVKCGGSHELLAFLMNLYETAFTTALGYVIKKFPIPDLVALYFRTLEDRENFSLSKNGGFFGYAEPFIADGIKIYPRDYFSPVSAYNNGMMVSAFSENTCLCHHFAATWKESGGTSTGRLFSELLREGYYSVDPAPIPAIKKRYPLPASPRRPAWSLGKTEIAAVEKVLNRIFPYGGFGYSILRKLRKR